MARIAVDAMGGDHAPFAPVRGACLALDEYSHIEKIWLVGREVDLRRELDRLGKTDDPRLEVVNADEVVEMHEASATALRKKRHSSIAVTAELIKEGRAQALVSAGHTGAAVASTVVKWRCLEGVERPGIGAVLPAPRGPFLLLDAGANVDAKPRHLAHYAVMGDVYAKEIMGLENPRVGLLSVGSEDGKGNELTRGAFERIRTISDINFVGNVEGHDLFEGHVDVVVCDGFAGNAVLKCCESLATVMQGALKEKLLATPLRKLGALLCRRAFQDMKRDSDCAESGGAPLLGVNGICIIAHGSSCETAMKNAIRVACESVEHQVNRHIITRVGALGAPNQ